MAREQAAPAGTEGDHVIGLRLDARHFHSRRAERHTADREASHTLGPGRESPLHIGNRHVALESHAIGDCCVAGRDVRRDPRALLQRRAIGIIDDAHLASELPLHLRCPLGATAAAGIAVHNDRGWPR